MLQGSQWMSSWVEYVPIGNPQRWRPLPDLTSRKREESHNTGPEPRRPRTFCCAPVLPQDAAYQQCGITLFDDSPDQSPPWRGG
jgi:hypothetical protein